MKGMLRNPFTTMSFLSCSQFQLLLIYLRFCNLISLSVNTSTVLSGKLYQIQSEDHFMLCYGTEHSHSCIILKLMKPNLWHSGQDTRGKRVLSALSFPWLNDMFQTNCFSVPCPLQQAHAPFPFIRAPKVYQHLSRKRVLTMEWMAGESPRDLIDMSTTVSVSDGSDYSKRKQSDARRRLLDLVCNDLNTSLLITDQSFSNPGTKSKIVLEPFTR